MLEYDTDDHHLIEAPSALKAWMIQLGRTKFNLEGEHEFSLIARRNAPLPQS
jgi:hypothetical protein